MDRDKVRIDLHVHSKFSKRPSQWLLQKLGCPESFTEPENVYRLARQRGMSLVTLSDHNTINGALEIAHLPGTFISEEVTTYFPRDGCKIHVLALNITESQHRDIRKVRENVYDLVEYLNGENILHILAHPLYSVNDRLNLEHFEQMLLLFKYFELNGARDDLPNQCLKKILPLLTPGIIEELADKYDYAPPFQEPWKKTLTGGSDDHSSLNIARTYTEIRDAYDIPSALEGIRNHRTRVIGRPSTPQTLAHNLYGIAYQFYRSRFNLEQYVSKDILMKFLDRSLSTDYSTDNGFFSRLCCFWTYKKRLKIKTDMPESLQDLLRHETHKLICNDPRLHEIVENNPVDFPSLEKKWYYFLNQASNKVLFHFANHLLGHFSGANVFNIFHTIGSAGGLYALLAPYFISFSLFSGDRKFSRQVAQRFASASPEVADTLLDEETVTVAHFTDTFYEVNGVALTLQQQVEMAIKNKKKLTVITCDPNQEKEREGIKNFKPVGFYELPEYEELKIAYPPFLDMLNYCYEEGFTRIHSATPGPIGLAALAIARILKLPISGTYHTAFPQYAQYLTGDESIEDLTWKYTLWYYDQMDFIYAPSESTRKELVERGIRPEKIRLFPRGIDTDRFHPSKGNGILSKRYHIEDCTTLLYVGRVSREKNLHLLVEAYKDLLGRHENVHLLIVGDGPYMTDMKEALRDTPCTFTGYLEGEELDGVYASSDIFVFPSTTDTFGNVVLEAQASGLPVIVSDEGGPHENVIDGETGLVISSNDSRSLLEAMELLVAHPARVETMGKAARSFMETRSFETAFIKTWKMYKDKSPADSSEILARAV